MILLFGYGLSNKSIERYLIKNNINYKVYDDNIDDISDLNEITLIVKSNGIKIDNKLIVEAKNRNIEILSDLQLFYLIDSRRDYVMVTGSNGKTTTVHMLEQCIDNAKAIGNNGLPFFDYIYSNKNKILEVSSFMLECSYNIKYKYNVITNLFNTHLEHHKTYIQYLKSKIKFLKNLNEMDILVYNYDDVLLKRIVDTYEFKKISVSLNNKNCDLYLDNGYVMHKDDEILELNKLKIIGEHNYYNVMFCLGIVLNHDYINDKYLNNIYNFSGVNYRMQLIYDGVVKVYNDSKSTNYKALAVAINSFNEKIILIVGGQKRNDDFNLIKRYIHKLKMVYCYGEAKSEFYNFFTDNKVECFLFDSLVNVINNIIIKENDIILFSPGCVSYDQFNNFEERGKIFNELIVKKLNILFCKNLLK